MPNNFSCIIIDDEQDACDLLKNRISDLFKQITVTATYLGWAEALQGLRENKADLLFVDISMPGKTGIDMLHLLPQLDCEIIFVTAHEEYALDAFAFSTSGYILKPVKDNLLAKAINKALERIEYKHRSKQPKETRPLLNDKIGVPGNTGIDYVTVSEIMYLESVNKCTRIVTTRADYLSSFQIGKFKDHVSGLPFFQVHRSYIINLNFIQSYKSAGILIMSNKMEIPVSRAERTEFLKIFNSEF
jgi:two-component system LytT family response regulator